VRVLIAPDSFAGTLAAGEAAAAIAAGWSRVAPQDDLDLVPLSDGGPGFVEALSASLGGDRLRVETRDALLRPAQAEVLIRGPVAYLESAQACGLHLLTPAERDPCRTTTLGVGDLIAAACGAGARQLVVGLGGSASNDGGAGVLSRLGLRLVGSDGGPLAPGGIHLAELDHIGREAGWHAPTDVVAATDVDNPLLGEQGATAVYGPQKGADASIVSRLEAALSRLVAVVRRDLPESAGVENEPGAGAAGGLGYGLMVLGARRASGIDLVLRAVELHRRARAADLVITGEGSFDRQSLHGKVVAGVAGVARAAGVRCVVLAGRVLLGPEEAAAAGITAAFAVSDEAGSLEAALAEPGPHLSALAARVAANWSTG
jgi:glycerate 2-kinase